MSYHLTFAQTLAMNWGIWITAVLGIAGVISALIMWRRYPRARGLNLGRNIAPIVGVVGVLLIALGGWFAYSEAGIGWTLTGATLNLKTGFGDEYLNTSDMSARLVRPTGPYSLSIRTNGVSAGNLQAGHFSLQNGNHALVFRYGNHPWLLIQTANATVLISSPHVNALATAIQAQSTQSGASAPATSGNHSTLSWLRIAVSVVLAAAFVAAQMALARRADPRLRDKLVTHWGFDGKPNGWMSKRAALRAFPIISGLMGAIGVATAVAGFIAVIILSCTQALILILARVVYQMNARS